jgi:hypothetical protein
MRWTPIVIASICALSASGCAYQPAPVAAPTVAPLVSTVAPIGGEGCREYQGTAEIGGAEQPVYGTACRQPDGTWRITNGSAGTSTAPSTVTSTMTYVYPYPAYGPWCCGPGFGSSFFFGGRFHHHHHHHGGGQHGHH